MRLQNKVAIVTGAGTGIGKGIAVRFAQEGASVVITGRRKEKLDETAAEIKKNNGKVLSLVSDVSKLLDVQHVVDETIKQFGHIDILVNNAGTYRAGSVESTVESDWDAVMAIDLKGLVFASKAVFPFMQKQNNGKIIHISSIAGIVGFPQSAAYCAAKGAIVNLTRQMALDFAQYNVCVNGIGPGLIASEMTEGIINDEAQKKAFPEKTPLKRIGSPDDIAYGAVYLASAESDFMTGQTLIIDGGWTIQ